MITTHVWVRQVSEVVLLKQSLHCSVITVIIISPCRTMWQVGRGQALHSGVLSVSCTTAQLSNPKSFLTFTYAEFGWIQPPAPRTLETLADVSVTTFFYRTGVGGWPTARPLTWKIRGCSSSGLYHQQIRLGRTDLPGAYAPAGIALDRIQTLKLHHYIRVKAVCEDDFSGWCITLAVWAFSTAECSASYSAETSGIRRLRKIY